MKLKDLISKIGRNYFDLMHLSYNNESSREPLWRYAYDKNRIGLDWGGMNKNWFDIPKRKREKALNWFWYRQFELFCENMIDGDCVLVIEGLSHLLGVGLVGEPYAPEDVQETTKYPEGFFWHVRPIRWLIKYKYKDRVPFKVPKFTNTLAYVNDTCRRWAVVNNKLNLTDKQLSRFLRKTAREPIIRQPHTIPRREIERAKTKLLSKSPEPRIDIENEISTLNSRSSPHLSRTLGRYPIIDAGSESVDISTGVDLIKSNVQIDVAAVYVPRDLTVSILESFRNDMRKFRALISEIENLIGISPKFTRICIDYAPNRDAFRFKHCILCNFTMYQKQKSFNFWLVTLAREFAYLIHPRRDMRHMNFMRDLIVKALENRRS